MKKFAVIITIIIALVVAALLSAAYNYRGSDAFSANSFPDNTLINGVDCSGLTFEQAEAKLSDDWNNRYIIIADDIIGKSEGFTDFGFRYDLAKQLNQAKKKHLVSAALNYYLNLPLNMDVLMTVKGGGDEFKEDLVSSWFFTGKKYMEASDAYVDLSDPDFPIIEEQLGTKPDADKFFADVTSHIQMGEFHFIFDEKKYYTAPEVRSDDPELIAYQKYCKKYLKQKITYKLGDETFTISPEVLDSLMVDDMSGKADEDAVAAYVTALAEKYDNIDKERNFTSLTGKEITVPSGTYGWEIDVDKEKEQLLADINSHKKVLREPEFSQKGYGEYTQDMGDTYIDVDISTQHVNYYKNGELIFSSPCVTGNRRTGTVTDTGAYYILNKIRNVTLRGDNGDGTEYASFVYYWLGVNWSGEGFHDANWRRSFGGRIWTYNGSHGCINMPPSRMPELYRLAEVGIPVAVHY